jgi:hypothetical protein
MHRWSGHLLFFVVMLHSLLSFFLDLLKPMWRVRSRVLTSEQDFIRWYNRSQDPSPLSSVHVVCLACWGFRSGQWTVSLSPLSVRTPASSSLGRSLQCFATNSVSINYIRTPTVDSSIDGRLDGVQIKLKRSVKNEQSKAAARATDWALSMVATNFALIGLRITHLCVMRIC